MSFESIYTSLATTYAESVAMVEDLAETSLASVYTPLLPPIFSKQDIITCLQKYKKVCDRLDKKLACLTLLTDYVVAAIANPFLNDIFQQDTTNRSKKYMMDIVSIGWVSLFQAIQNSLPMKKPSKDAMEATLSFLRRMDHLLQPCDMRLSSLRLTSVSDPCFWSCGLQAIDGREAPVKFVSRIEKKFVGGFPQDSELEEIFGTDDDISSSTKQGEIFVSASPSPRSPVSMALGVKRLHVASLQLKSGVEQVVDCQVGGDGMGMGVVLIITTRGGNCAKVVLGVKEMSAIVLSLKGEEMLFLFLTVAGCLAVQNSFSRLPGMSVPPMALLGGQNRRLVVFLKKMGQEEGKRLTDALRAVMGEKFALAGQSFGKRLLVKTVEHGKLFRVAGEKGGGEAVARYGDRVQGVVGRREEDKLSMVNRYNKAEDREVGRTFNYWADPSLLLSQEASLIHISSTLPSSQKAFPTLQSRKMMSSTYPTLPSSQMSPLSIILPSQMSPTSLQVSQMSSSFNLDKKMISHLPSISSPPTLHASQESTPLSSICSSPTLPASQLSSPLPTRHPPAACHCSPSTQPACSICRPAKAVSQPAVGRGALQALDIPVIFADNKEEFLQLNASNVQSKLPREEALQAKYLEMKWIELNIANRKRKAEDGDEREVQKPRVNVIKSLANPPKESNGLASPNIQTPESDPASTPTNTFALPKSTLADTTSNRNSSLMPSIATVLSEQSTSPSGKCECDDCLYVTKSHMERTRVGMNKCKCHPCVLRGKQVAGRIAKPWELVTLADYEGDNYWLEPWIEDLFRDIKQKKMTVKKAAMMTGTTYGQVYRQYKEGLARLTM